MIKVNVNITEKVFLKYRIINRKMETLKFYKKFEQINKVFYLMTKKKSFLALNQISR